MDVESAGSSNSSSSESDSDQEDVDREVEKLNASLTEQTAEQNKALTARPESSSSFNLCKYKGKISLAHHSMVMQPDDVFPLCKYLQFTDFENNQFLKK